MGKKKRGGKGNPKKGTDDSKSESSVGEPSPEKPFPVAGPSASASASPSGAPSASGDPPKPRSFQEKMARYDTSPTERQFESGIKGEGEPSPVGGGRVVGIGDIGRGRGRGRGREFGHGPTADFPPLGQSAAAGSSKESSPPATVETITRAMETFPPLSSPAQQTSEAVRSQPVVKPPAFDRGQGDTSKEKSPAEIEKAEGDRSVSPRKPQPMLGKGSPEKKIPVKLEIKVESPKAMPSSTQSIKPIPRPNFGKKGRPIMLRANFFEMKIREDAVIYHYDIDIKPEIKSKERMRQIFDTFVKSNAQTLFKGIYPVYDGRKSMYTHKELRLSQKQEKFQVQLEQDRPGAKPFVVAVQYATLVSLSSLLDFYRKSNEYPQDAVQALDVVLRETPNHRFIPLRQYFFTNPAGGNLNNCVGLELWKGFYQSVRPGWKCMMLQVDASVRVFHKGQRVLDLCAEFFKCNVKELNDRPMNDKERSDFESHIKGLQIEIDTERFQMLTRRSYKLIGLSANIAKDQTFPMSQPDGKEIPTKVADYFFKQYNIRLEFPVLHCLQAQPADKHRYLPMELCIVKKGQQLKKLTEALTSQLITYSAIPATDREKQICDLVARSDYNRDPITSAYGMSINNRMIEFEARVLAAPTIQYSQDQKITVFNGSWNMQRVKFYSCAVVRQMAVVCFDQRTQMPVLENFAYELIKNAKEVGMTLPVPCAYEFRRQANDVEPTMRDLSRRIPNLDLIIVVLPAMKSNDIYGEVKKVGDLELGVATQCVQQKNVFMAKVQTLVNICLKINAKLGETNSIIDLNQKTPIMLRPVMIMGADVTHPSPGDTSNPSIAAVTGSYDVRACRYAARISMQMHRQEIIADLEGITKQLLDNFVKHLNRKPERIIFYRDGVSEGQFKEVLSTELQAIQKACYALERGYEPAITFITVQKRHHTRLFAKDPKEQVGKSKNVPAGTTVDTTIVHPIEFDFYLCSHQGIQGTSRPAHYYVLYDDSNFSADDIQELTYRLCHVYARCTRSVSIPAPVYYAHHCAFRGRYYLDRMGRDGRLPDNDRHTKAALDLMNNKCLIRDCYKGMFFA